MSTEKNAMPFRVSVDDNYHDMDESERYVLGHYPTGVAAIGAAQAVVDEFLAGAFRPGMTPDALYEQYTMFGEDPFVECLGEERVTFSAWTYARERCDRLCGKATGPVHPR